MFLVSFDAMRLGLRLRDERKEHQCCLEGFVGVEFQKY